MLEDLFRGNEVAQSTVLGVSTSLLASFCLSFLLVLTYRFTSREVIERREFTQGLALISLVATMIVQAIGDSIARGLGLLAALSIIRFRTSLSSPRNMAFMFASLAVGIACGVFGFVIALCGTVAFCIVAIALSFEYRDGRDTLTGELRVTLPADPAAATAFEQIVKPHTSRLRLEERRFEREKPPKQPKPVKASASEVAATAAAAAIAAASGLSPKPANDALASPDDTTADEMPSSIDPNSLPLQQILTYAFRLRKPNTERALYDAVHEHASALNQRLRFAHQTESL